jgi:AraC family transcriptional regulator
MEAKPILGRAPIFSTIHSSNKFDNSLVSGRSMISIAPNCEKLSGTYPLTGISGTVVRRREIPGFSITDNVYSEGLHLSRHYHRDAYLNFILAGEYSENYANTKAVCGAGMLRFLPPEELHENHYTSGARCLIVKIDSSLVSRLGEHASVLSTPGEVQGFASSWLANRLHREFMGEDDIAPLAIEGVLLEILAESARAIGNADGARAPKWLKRVRDRLEAGYLASPSLTELAEIGGVHQVHLSREFRKHYHCTIGEFIRKRRVEHACRLLAQTNTTLSEIALMCGFSDQSHFSAMFKAHVGLTPAKYREMS